MKPKRISMGISSLRFILFILLIGCHFLGFAQSKYEIKGDNQVSALLYLDATISYLKALQEDKNNNKIKLKLARCYHKLNDPEQTAKWYGDIINTDDLVESSDKFNYAMALLSTNKLMEAERQFKSYTEEVPEDSRAGKFLNQIKDIKILYRDSSLHKINMASFNSPASDFGPTYYKNGIVFVSSRASSRESYSWDKSAFLDLYYCHRRSLGLYDSPVPFHEKINTNYHEGPVCFYDNDKKMILTRNNINQGKLGKSEKGVTKLKLYFTSVDSKSGWTDLKEFEYNSDEYSLGHPAISADGKTLYFISDMPGGYGGTDIYKSQFQNGAWSNPENLGEVVNTKGNEMFPYLLNNQKLYFSSNGQGGLGGLDIFEYDINQSKIRNLGYPINSSMDDFGYIVNEYGEGYFSSNRNTTDQSDNIYEFMSLKAQLASVKILVVHSNNNQPFPKTAVTLKQVETDSIQILTTQDDGYINHPLLLNRSYDITVTMPGYRKVIKRITPVNATERVLIKLQAECLTASGQVKLAGEESTKESLKLLLEDNAGRIKDSLEIYNYEHFEFCVNANAVYTLKAIKKDYFTKSTPIVAAEDGTIYVGEITLEKIVINKAITLENIYYDLGKWNIRSDASKELDKLANLLADNPTIEIELSSHTDSRGSDASNLSLSKKRAKSAAEYIVSKGVDSERIQYKGYGETNLINHCANGVDCTVDQHQANRRTEFKVLKY